MHIKNTKNLYIQLEYTPRLYRAGFYLDFIGFSIIENDDNILNVTIECNTISSVSVRKTNHITTITEIDTNKPKKTSTFFLRTIKSWLDNFDDFTFINNTPMSMYPLYIQDKIDDTLNIIIDNLDRIGQSDI